jgi:hypothetical protein
MGVALPVVAEDQPVPSGRGVGKTRRVLRLMNVPELRGARHGAEEDCE